VFYNDEMLNRLKRTRRAYVGYKGAFTSFRALLRVFLQEHLDLGVTIESETDHSVRLVCLDQTLDIALSMVASTQPLRGVIKLNAVDRSGEREKKIELTRIYIDDLGNAWNSLKEDFSLENITMRDGAIALILKWLCLFLDSDEFKLPAQK